MTELWAILLVVFATILGALGAFFIKRSGGITKDIKKLLTNKLLILGILLYGFSPVFNIIAFRGGELTVLYPLISFTYIWSSILAVKYLNEKMDAYRWAGIALIVIGAALIVR